MHIPAAHVPLILTKDANSSGKGGGVEGLDCLEVDVWVSEGSLGRGWDDRRFMGGVTPRLRGWGWGWGGGHWWLWSGRLG